MSNNVKISVISLVYRGEKKVSELILRANLYR